MEDQWTNLTSDSKLTCFTSEKVTSKVASVPNTFTKSLGNVASRDHVRKGIGGNVAVFLLKVAALETTRRLSRAKCPFVWHGFQAFQMLCYPPFKWFQRWAPLKGLVQGMQMFSRPFLVLSIATAFSDKYEIASLANDHDVSDACADTDKEEAFSDQPCVHTMRKDEISNCPSSEHWLVKLYEELESQGISLPERINKNELQRFYNAADGNFAGLLSSIKKTIRWRETYTILSQEELKMWSNMVFWHGYDGRHRPYLVVRLGLAYSSLAAPDRPRFAQAIVSQIEHGVVQLANHENPCIMVLVDCEGLSPFRVPMQMMRSCCLLFQDHFPNCLGGLYVIRLPSVVRVMAQTLIKMLKPVTRQKLKFIGERYQEVLSDYFQKLPAYLGGKCTCCICSSTSSCITQQFSPTEVADDTHLTADGFDYGDIAVHSEGSEVDIQLNFDQLLRTGMMGILMFCVFVALLAGMYDLENHQNLLS